MACELGVDDAAAAATPASLTRRSYRRSLYVREVRAGQPRALVDGASAPRGSAGAGVGLLGRRLYATTRGPGATTSRRPSLLVAGLLAVWGGHAPTQSALGFHRRHAARLVVEVPAAPVQVALVLFAGAARRHTPGGDHGGSAVRCKAPKCLLGVEAAYLVEPVPKSRVHAFERAADFPELLKPLVQLTQVTPSSSESMSDSPISNHAPGGRSLLATTIASGQRGPSMAFRVARP